MKILIVGEHPLTNELAAGPFSNGLWRYFKLELNKAGIAPADCGWVYTVNKPCASMFALTQRDKRGSSFIAPGLAKAAYLRAEFDTDLRQLAQYIERVKPNLILAVGDMPCVVLTGHASLDATRGRVTSATKFFGGGKVLCCYSPRAIMSDNALRPILAADLRKAQREAEFPEIRRPQRFLHLRPSLEDLEDFWQEYIVTATHLSVDIETIGTMITCVGVAPYRDRALVIPFFDEEQPLGNYWESHHHERLAWRFVERCLEAEGKLTLGQNFSYDAQYFLRKMAIKVPNWTDDTMVLHHALQPEMPKGLGFLASIYTDAPAWKGMHKRKSADRSGKKEDV